MNIIEHVKIDVDLVLGAEGYYVQDADLEGRRSTSLFWLLLYLFSKCYPYN